MIKAIGYAGMWLLAAGVAFAAGDAAAGKVIYNKACKTCHGESGAPNPGIAKAMNVKMAHLGDPAVQSLSDDELKSIVTTGKGKMKAVKSVSGKALDDVTAYLRTFKK